MAWVHRVNASLRAVGSSIANTRPSMSWEGSFQPRALDGAQNPQSRRRSRPRSEQRRDGPRLLDSGWSLERWIRGSGTSLKHPRIDSADISSSPSVTFLVVLMMDRDHEVEPVSIRPDKIRVGDIGSCMATRYRCLTATDR